MKTIGLLGGMSWESTVTYYQTINEIIKQKLGGLHSAKVLLYSVDFAEIEKCQAEGDWEKSADILSAAAENLEKAGADFIVICTNTMHKVAPRIQSRIKIPILHIAEATAEELKLRNITKVALLGTKYTMTQDFYKEKLTNAGIAVLIPDEQEIETINDVIYHELCLGIISETSKEEYRRIIDGLARQGAQGVILGCTEIGLLIQQKDTDLPVFDTTQIHASKAAMLSIEN
ncbi:aspartate/glutamate racemase family protein [Lacrimispora sp.]|uniref:aspartate/glutamate racemase family protein n=1 Tax=Lacrimispora sp. TaxID=2719234 RepID=UPI002FDA15C2